MKRSLLIIILFTSSICLYSQSYRLGIGVNILTGNKYLNYEVGPALNLNYNLKKLPISINGNAIFSLSELSKSNNISTGYTRSVFSLGIGLNYYPIKWAIMPYLGLVTFYNINNLSQSGTPSPSSEGFIRSPGSIKNNFSAEIHGGIIFSANTSINFIVEVSKTYNRPSYNLKITDTRGEKYTSTYSNETFDFNSIFLRLGLNFEI